MSIHGLWLMHESGNLLIPCPTKYLVMLLHQKIGTGNVRTAMSQLTVTITFRTQPPPAHCPQTYIAAAGVKGSLVSWSALHRTHLVGFTWFNLVHKDDAVTVAITFYTNRRRVHWVVKTTVAHPNALRSHVKPYLRVRKVLEFSVTFWTIILEVYESNLLVQIPWMLWRSSSDFSACRVRVLSESATVVGYCTPCWQWKWLIARYLSIIRITPTLSHNISRHATDLKNLICWRNHDQQYICHVIGCKGCFHSYSDCCSRSKCYKRFVCCYDHTEDAFPHFKFYRV